VVAQWEPSECGAEELEAVCGFVEQGDVRLIRSNGSTDPFFTWCVVRNPLTLEWESR
jgi:hypothetical protein